MEKVDQIKGIVRERTAEKKSLFLRRCLSVPEEYFDSAEEMKAVAAQFQKEGWCCRVQPQPLSTDKNMLWLKWN